MPSSQPSIVCTNCAHALDEDALFCPKCGTARSRDVNGDPLMGAVIGDRFLILERLGHGGSGTIYRAEHVTLRRKVAVKVLHHELSRDDLAVERFRREATTVSEIDNDHIAEIHDFGHTADGRLYLAMELLEGETLQDVIRRQKRLGIDHTVDVLLQLGEALTEAHAMGYVHRDLRPRNVWLSSRRGRPNFVKLLDFGLAKLVQHEGRAASTSLGMTFGDPKYMSPEQARGEAVDRRADIYSMGCIAYEMLVGEPPFAGSKVFDILTQHTDTLPGEPRQRRDEVPAWLSDVVMRMLAKKPEDRFITVLALIEALRQQTATPTLPSEEPVAGAPAVERPATESGVRKQRARSTILYGQSPEEGAARDGAGAAASETASQTADQAERDGAGSDRASASGSHRRMGAEAVETEHRRAAARKTSPGVPVKAVGPAASASAVMAAVALGDRDSAEAAETALAPAPPVGAAPAAAQVAAPAREAREPREAREARDASSTSGAPSGSGASAPSGSGASAPSGSGASASGSQRARKTDPGDALTSSGLSGDWFADATGAVDESGRRSDSIQAFRDSGRMSAGDSGDTSLIGEEIYADPGRKRVIRIAGAVGGAVLLIVIIALLWPRGDKVSERQAAMTPDARPSNAAAILANIQVDAAPAAAAPAVDAGPASTVTPGAAGATTPGTTPGTAGATTPPAGPATTPPVARVEPKPPSQPATTPRPTNPRTGQDTDRGTGTGSRPTQTPLSPATPRERVEPEPAGGAGGNASENAKQAVFFTKMGEQALHNGDMFGAMRHFKQALELDPKNADAIIGQGEIAYSQGSYANAISHFEKAARMRPRSAQVHVLLGQAYLGAGNNAKAANSFKRALQIQPDDTRAQRGYTEATGNPPP
ncbi:MAG TPA: protein kinase [Haliangium sp.]|nr:protein kinase [Haliangium sp.]